MKAHAVVGVKTNVITAVEIHDRNTNDSPILLSLINTTAKNFTVREVSGGKQYASMVNLEAMDRIGAGH